MREILRRCANDGLSIDDAVGLLRDLPYQDLGFAKVDHHRAIRTGFPEVVFGEGKTPNQTATIAQAILQQSDVLLVTRASQEMYSAVLAGAPDATYDEMARTVIVDRREHREHLSGVLVLCAGTADLPVATEAAITAELMGCEVERVFDVGVAGIHRLLDQLETLQRARVLIAVAGMEGALPSVVGGLVRGAVGKARGKICLERNEGQRAAEQIVQISPNPLALSRGGKLAHLTLRSSKRGVLVL